MKDFETLEVLRIQDVPNGKAGFLPDGRHVNVRIKSTEGSPTLEIFDKIKNRRIKIRYIE